MLEKNSIFTEKDNNWDEICFMYIKQTTVGREHHVIPKARLVCFSKKVVKTPDNKSQLQVYMSRSDDYDKAIDHVKGMNRTWSEPKTESLAQIGDTVLLEKYEIKLDGVVKDFSSSGIFF